MANHRTPVGEITGVRVGEGFDGEPSVVLFETTDHPNIIGVELTDRTMAELELGMKRVRFHHERH